jgi:DNA-binding response OmpR family regulator
MLRVVADANVLISAALARSPNAPSVLTLDAALDGRLELITSPLLLGEIASVLARPRLRKYPTTEQALRFLTARVDELHKVRVLDRVGDDVLAKPYAYPELRARLAALLRRARARQAPRVLRVGELTIDLASRTVEISGTKLELPAKGVRAASYACARTDSRLHPRGTAS